MTRLLIEAALVVAAFGAGMLLKDKVKAAVSRLLSKAGIEVDRL